MVKKLERRNITGEKEKEKEREWKEEF